MTRLAWLWGVLLMGCGEAPSDDSAVPELVDPLAWDVLEHGPYRVGHRTLEVTYAPLSGESRTLPVHLWYPTEAETGAEVRYLEMFVDTESLGEAEPRPAVHADGYPVMAFTHGHQGFGGIIWRVANRYASHGWVVVSPDHVGNLLTDNPDEEPAGFNTWRPLDVIASVDALEAGVEGFSSPFATSRIVLSGHSRGATTTWTLAGATPDPSAETAYCDGCSPEQAALFQDGSLTDPRVVASVPMGGTYRESWFGPTGYTAVDHPVMSILGSEDGDSQQAQWDLISGIDFTWLNLVGGCHESFTLGICDTLDPEVGLNLTETYHLAWGRKHLLSDTDPTVLGLLDGSVTQEFAEILVK